MSSPPVYTLQVNRSERIAEFLPSSWIVQNLGPGNVWLTDEDSQGEQAGILIRPFGHVRGGPVDAVYATTDTAGTRVTLIRDPLAHDILNLAPAAAPVTAGHIIADEGVPLAQRGTLDFAGAGVTVTDGPGDRSLVTIPGGGGGAADVLTQEVNLGSLPRYAGKFTLADAGILAGSLLLVQLAAGPYTGKGTLADEAQMHPGLVFMPEATGVGSRLVHWAAPKGGIVQGNVKVNYLIG